MPFYADHDGEVDPKRANALLVPNRKRHTEEWESAWRRLTFYCPLALFLVSCLFSSTSILHLSLLGLSYKRGETLHVLRMTGCPGGHWECRNIKGDVGFVPAQGEAN
jgi:hypothetical protein